MLAAVGKGNTGLVSRMFLGNRGGWHTAFPNKMIPVFREQTRGISDTSVAKAEHLIRFNLGVIEGVEHKGDIWCPFESGRNQFHLAVGECAQNWTLHQGLFKENTEPFAEFNKLGISNLAANCFREESKEDLELAIRFLSWIYAYNDLVNTVGSEFRADDNKLNGLNMALLGLFEKDVPIVTDNENVKNLSGALLNFRNGLSEYGGCSDHLSFLKKMRLFFQGYVLRAGNREMRLDCSYLNRIEINQYVSILDPCLELMSIFRSKAIDEGYSERIFYIASRRNARNFISFSRDIFLFESARYRDSEENEVCLLSNEKEINSMDALDSVLKVMNLEIRNFFQNRDLLLEGGHIPMKPLEDMMRGYVDWAVTVKGRHI